MYMHHMQNGFVLKLYLVSPSEETGCVDVRVGVIFIVWHLDVVPHAVVDPGHDASDNTAQAALARNVTSWANPTSTGESVRKPALRRKLHFLQDV